MSLSTNVPKELCRQEKWGHGKVKRLLGTGAGSDLQGLGILHYRLPQQFLQGRREKRCAGRGAHAGSGEKSGGGKEGTTAAPAPTPAKAPSAKPTEGKPKTAIQMIKLVCPDCQRENEPERIYCHDCGTRLDRSALAKEKAKEENPQETQRRVAKMFDPRRAILRRRFFQGCKLLLGALLLAAVVQMLRPPDVPEPPKASMLPTQVSLELESLATGQSSAPLQYSDEQANAYLAYTLKGKQAALSKYLKFERAIVTFDEGHCRFTVERSLYGFSVFTTASYAATLQNGNIVTRNRGLHIGRMPIHPALMQYAGILFTDVRAALERERKSTVKLGSIESHPHVVIFTPKPPPQT